MTKRKTAGILATVLMTAAVAATVFAFAGCTTTNTKDDSVLFSTTFTMGVMGDASFTFNKDGTGNATCEQMTSLNGPITWKYNTDQTEMSFEWGEGGTSWNVKPVTVGDTIVTTEFSSDSPIVAIKGPFIAYPDGVTAALTSTENLSFSDGMKGANVNLILFDKATVSYTDDNGKDASTNLIFTYGESVFYTGSWTLTKDNQYSISAGPFGTPVSKSVTASGYQTGKPGAMSFDNFGLSAAEFTQLKP